MAKKKFINQLYRKNKSSRVTSKTLQEQSVNAILTDPENRTLWINGNPYGNAYIDRADNNYDNLSTSDNYEDIGTIHGEIFNDFDNNEAKGNYSHAEGKGTQTKNEGEHAEGKYNYSIKAEDVEIEELDTDAKLSRGTISTIGIGTNNENRKNAFRVDNTGEVYIVGVDSTLPDGRKVSYDPCNYDGTKKTVETRSLQEVIQGLGTMQEVTYGELRTLIDNKRLIPGMQYRITDYTNTFNVKTYNKSFKGNKFDIIVVADSEDTLNKNARACHHDFENELKDLVNKEININTYPVTFDDFYNNYYKLNADERSNIISNIIYGDENPEDKEIYIIYNKIYDSIKSDAAEIEANKQYFINTDIESWKIIYNVETDSDYGIFDNSFYNEKIIINVKGADDYRYLCEYSYVTDIYYVLGNIEYKYKWVLNKVQKLPKADNSKNISYFDDDAVNTPYTTYVGGLRNYDPEAENKDTDYDDKIGLYLLTSSKYPTNENRGKFLFVSNAVEGKNTDQKYPYIKEYENNNLKYNDVLLFSATTNINEVDGNYYFLYNGQEGQNYTWYIVENTNDTNKNMVLPGEYAYESSNWKKQEFSDDTGKYHVLLKINDFTPYPLLFADTSKYEIYKEYISYNENNSEKSNINNFGICEKYENPEYMFFYKEDIHIELTDKIFEYIDDNNIKYYCAIWESQKLPNFIIITNPVKTIEETLTFKDLKFNGNIKFFEETDNWKNNYQIINITKENLSLSNFTGILYNKIIMQNIVNNPVSFADINNPEGKRIYPFDENIESTEPYTFSLYDNYYIKENNESLYKTINNQQTLKYSTSDNLSFDILVDINNYNTIIYYIDYVSKNVTYENDDIFKFFNKEYNTTGYISELIDEFNNKANFDFKNVLLNKYLLFSNNTNDLSLTNLVNNNNIYIDNIFNSNNYINIKSNSSDSNINFNTISGTEVNILCDSLINNTIFNSTLKLSNINNIKNNNIVNSTLSSDRGVFNELTDNKISNSYLSFSTIIQNASNINIKNNIINNAYNDIGDDDNILPLKISDTYENNVIYDYYKDNVKNHFKDELSNDNQNRIKLPNIQTYKVENTVQEQAQTISEESGEGTSDTPEYISIIPNSIYINNDPSDSNSINLLDGSDINNFNKTDGVITDYHVYKSNENNKGASGQYYEFSINNTDSTNNYSINISTTGTPQADFAVFNYLFDSEYADDEISCKIYLYKYSDNANNYSIQHLKTSHTTGMFSLQEQPNNIYLEGTTKQNIRWKGNNDVLISTGKTLNINKIPKSGWLSDDTDTYYQYNNGYLSGYYDSMYSYSKHIEMYYNKLGHLVKDYSEENNIEIKAKANRGIILSAPAFSGNRIGEWDTVYKCPMIEPNNKLIIGSSEEFIVSRVNEKKIEDVNIVFNLYKSQFNPNDQYYLYIRFFSYRTDVSKKYTTNICTTEFDDNICNAFISNKLSLNINNLQTLPSCIIPLDTSNIINNDENNFAFNFNINEFDCSIVDKNKISFKFDANFNLTTVKSTEYKLDKFLDLDYDNISSNYDKNNLIKFNNDNLIINSSNNIFDKLSSTSSIDFTFNKIRNTSSYNNFTQILSCTKKENTGNLYAQTYNNEYSYGWNKISIDFNDEKYSDTNKSYKFEFKIIDNDSNKISIDNSNAYYNKFTPKTNGIENKVNILNDDTYIKKIGDIYPYFDPDELKDGDFVLVTEQDSLSINNIDFNIKPIDGDNEPHLCFLTSFYRTLRHESSTFNVKFSCDIITTLNKDNKDKTITTKYSTDYMNMEYGASWNAVDDWDYCSGLFYVNLFNILKHIKISTQSNLNEFNIKSVEFKNFKVDLNFWTGGTENVTWIGVSNVYLASGNNLRGVMTAMNNSLIGGFKHRTINSNDMGCYSVLCGSTSSIDSRFNDIRMEKNTQYRIRPKISASLRYYKVVAKAIAISNTATDNMLNNIVVSHNNGLSVCNIPDIHNIDVSDLKVNGSLVSLVNIPIKDINNKVDLYSGVLFTYYHPINGISYKFMYLKVDTDVDDNTITMVEISDIEKLSNNIFKFKTNNIINLSYMEKQLETIGNTVTQLENTVTTLTNTVAATVSRLTADITALEVRVSDLEKN